MKRLVRWWLGWWSERWDVRFRRLLASKRGTDDGVSARERIVVKLGRMAK